MAGDPRQTLGILGEELACEALTRRGYAILARRFRTRLGEIDIVARDGDTLVFVEVKTRQGGAFGDGAEAVGPRKQQKLGTMALLYLARHRLVDVPVRFDVVAVRVGESGTRRVDVFQQAFDFTVAPRHRW
ncbi:MAG: YraN family protein [Vicinamibacterales bacterium]